MASAADNGERWHPMVDQSQSHDDDVGVWNRPIPMVSGTTWKAVLLM